MGLFFAVVVTVVCDTLSKVALGQIRLENGVTKKQD